MEREEDNPITLPQLAAFCGRARRSVGFVVLEIRADGADNVRCEDAQAFFVGPEQQGTMLEVYTTALREMLHIAETQLANVRFRGPDEQQQPPEPPAV